MFRRLLAETPLNINKSQKRHSSTNTKLGQLSNILSLNKNISFFNSPINFDDDESTAHSSRHRINELMPDEKEISSLKKGLNYYYEDINKYFSEIEFFMKNLNDVYSYIKKSFKDNMHYKEIMYFVDSFYDGKKNMDDIIKFRCIYSTIISEKQSEKNNKILSQIYNRKKK